MTDNSFPQGSDNSLLSVPDTSLPQGSGNSDSRQSRKTDKFKEYENEKSVQYFKSSVANFRRVTTRLSNQLQNPDVLDMQFFEIQNEKLSDHMQRVRNSFSNLESDDQNYGKMKDVFEHSEKTFQDIMTNLDNHIFMMQNYDFNQESVAIAPSQSKESIVASQSCTSVSSKSDASVCSSRSKYSSCCSNTSTKDQEKLKAVADVAALKVRLQYFDKEVEFRNELKRLKLLRNLNMAEAKKRAIDQIDDLDTNDNNNVEKVFNHPESSKEKSYTFDKGSFSQGRSLDDIGTTSNFDKVSKVSSKGRLLGDTSSSTTSNLDSSDNGSKVAFRGRLLDDKGTPSMSNSSFSEEKIDKMIHEMAKSTNLNRLPVPEPQVFSGNTLEYSRWKTSVQTLIDNRGIPDIEKVHYLMKYVAGEVKDIVDGYTYSITDKTYYDVLETLDERYGNKYRISCAFRSKLAKWPKIFKDDAIGLQKYADFLQQIKVASRSIDSLKVLNDEHENQKMLQKMPEWFILRWSRHVGDLQDNNEPFPSFSEFADYVKGEAKKANDPIVSLQSVKASAGENVHTFSTEVNTSKQVPIERPKMKCLFCSGNHFIDVCHQFISYPVDHRRIFVWKNDICFGCLTISNHRSKDCTSKLTCKFCGKGHPSSLHTNGPRSKGKIDKDGQNQNDNSSQVKPIHTQQFTNSFTSHKTKGASNDQQCGQECKSTMIVPVWLSHPDSPKEIMIYALLDTQSNCSFVLDSTVESLNVSGDPTTLTLSTMTDLNKLVESKKVQGLSVRGYNCSEIVRLPPVYTRNEIPANKSNIPTPETVAQWPHLKDLSKKLVPVQNVPIALLIGCNCPMVLQPLDIIRSKGNQPFAQRSILGWGVIGMLNHNQVMTDEVGFSHRIICTDERSDSLIVLKTSVKEVINPVDVNNMMSLDFVEYNSEEKDISYEDTRFLKLMQKEIHVTEEGKYEMPLPLKNPKKIFPNNRSMALKRFQSLLFKFGKDPKYKEDYVNFMNDILNKGLAEKVPDQELSNKNVWYIPHHGVYNPRKPEKIRVVFDCSAKFAGESLNDNLMTGPDLTNNLVGVLLRFRQENVAFSCDVEQMFYQFFVNPDHRDFLRFLWFDRESDQISEFRMKVHLFGASSSPACANFGLKQAANDNESACGQRAASFIRNEFYVDDGLTSTESIDEAKDVIHASQEICKNAGLKLHKFASNKSEVLENIDSDHVAKDLQKRNFQLLNPPIEKVLGVGWCLDSDTFRFKVQLENKPITRRGILSTVSSVFDPLGLLAPVILPGKQILQELCRENVGWDSEIPETAQIEWEKWKKDLISLEQIKISRCYKPENFGSIKEVQMHHFSDASTKGYGQCSYIRLVNEEKQVHCSLIMGKSRVTPLKHVSIPRLELTAAVTSVRVGSMLSKELNYKDVQHFYWTDSKVVLGYVSNDTKRFQVYVANRVQEIRNKSNRNQWNYVKTKDNPADIASRGVSPKELAKNYTWFNGPEFLWKEDIDKSLNHSQTFELDPDDPEVKKCQVHLTQGSDSQRSELLQKKDFIFDLNRFSSWIKTKRVLALCLKFIHKLKLKKSKVQLQTNDKITVTDLAEAESMIIRFVQHASFKEEKVILKDNVSGKQKSQASIKKTSALHGLDPFIDSEGIIRVGGRLRYSGDDFLVKHPIILPKVHHITSLIVQHFHTLGSHQGRGITSNLVRSNGFWVIGLRSVSASLIHKCVTCRKNRSLPMDQKMADLPDIRSEESAPFTCCGVDIFGPFTVREGRKDIKRYGVLFTCLASRAVHLDIASSLSTDAFINALRRFCAIRGPIRQLYSDRGTNFVGSDNELHKLNQDRIQNYLVSRNCDYIEWKFNIPDSSHKGGVWERQIRTVRSILSQMLNQLGDQLDEDSLRTFIHETMYIINSRPLSIENMYDPDFPEPITPNHILTMKSNILLQPPGNFVREDMYSRKRWRRVQYLLNVFWTRWKSEYLQNLQERKKWTKEKPNLMTGDIVMLKEEDSPRNKWPLGRVISAPVSDDGLVRHDKIKCANGHTYERSVQKLFLVIKCDEQ